MEQVLALAELAEQHEEAAAYLPPNSGYSWSCTGGCG
jgi:hypothetical protein